MTPTERLYMRLSGRKNGTLGWLVSANPNIVTLNARPANYLWSVDLRGTGYVLVCDKKLYGEGTASHAEGIASTVEEVADQLNAYEIRRQPVADQLAAKAREVKNCHRAVLLSEDEGYTVTVDVEAAIVTELCKELIVTELCKEPLSVNAGHVQYAQGIGVSAPKAAPGYDDQSGEEFELTDQELRAWYERRH